MAGVINSASVCWTPPRLQMGHSPSKRCGVSEVPAQSADSFLVEKSLITR